MSLSHNLWVSIPGVSSCRRIPQTGRYLWGSTFYPVSSPLHGCVNSEQSHQQNGLTPAGGCWCLEMKMEQALLSATLTDGWWGVTVCSSATVRIGSTLLPEASPNVTSNSFKVKMENITKHILYGCLAQFVFRCVPDQNVLGVKHILIVNLLCQLKRTNYLQEFQTQNCKHGFFFFFCNLTWCLCKSNKLTKWALICAGEFPLSTDLPAVTGQDGILD